MTSGLRGGRNLASGVVAGTLAYFLWVKLKPSQDLKLEQERSAAASDRVGYVQKVKPVSDPQETRLNYGDKKKLEDLDK